MVMQNIGNHSRLSQFSKEGCLLCFLPSSFETAFHLNIFPRCGAVGEVWEISDHSVEKWSLFYPSRHGPDAAGSPKPESWGEQGEGCRPYLQTIKTKMLATGFPCKLLTAVFPEFLDVIWSPPQKDFTVFVQAYKTRGHQQAFQDEYWWTITILFTASWECKLKKMNVKGPQWAMCSSSSL